MTTPQNKTKSHTHIKHLKIHNNEPEHNIKAFTDLWRDYQKQQDTTIIIFEKSQSDITPHMYDKINAEDITESTYNEKTLIFLLFSQKRYRKTAKARATKAYEKLKTLEPYTLAIFTVSSKKAALYT